MTCLPRFIKSQDSDDEDEESVVKYRELPPGKVVSLHVSGQRGLACVMTSTVGSRLGSKRVCISTHNLFEPFELFSSLRDN